MREILGLDRWPLHELGGLQGQELVERCRDELRDVGMFSLDAFIRTEALGTSVAEVAPVLDTAPFTHSRNCNIYFDDEIEGLDPDHPALGRFATVNHTICGDQIPESVITRIYEWQPLIDFLALVIGKPRLYPMADALGRINVMAYREGEQLNWHFDRAEFTTTVLLQRPRSGGEFQYRSALRTESDPNYEGVARLLAGEVEHVRTLPLEAGTLNASRERTPRTGCRPSRATDPGLSLCSPTTRARVSRSGERSVGPVSEGQGTGENGGDRDRRQQREQIPARRDQHPDIGSGQQRVHNEQGCSRKPRQRLRARALESKRANQGKSNCAAAKGRPPGRQRRAQAGCSSRRRGSSEGEHCRPSRARR